MLIYIVRKALNIFPSGVSVSTMVLIGMAKAILMFFEHSFKVYAFKETRNMPICVFT
jgi:hypothetical protein